MSDRKNIEKATKLNEFLIAKGYNPDEMSLEEKKAVGHNILLEGSLLGGGYCVFEYLNVEFQTGLLFLPTSTKESKQIGKILKLPTEDVVNKYFPGLKVGDIAILEGGSIIQQTPLLGKDRYLTPISQIAMVFTTEEAKEVLLSGAKDPFEKEKAPSLSRI